MKVLVCGARVWGDRDRLFHILDGYNANRPITCVVHGDAVGADCMGGEWAESRGVPVVAIPADWQKHGRAAGPIRNQRMLDEHKDIEMVIGFIAGESRGTHDMLARARKSGVHLVVRIHEAPNDR